ncbi:MAG: PAS domain-containing protein, partial [Candidatus Limnocylindrales bacterium]
MFSIGAGLIAISGLLVPGRVSVVAFRRCLVCVRRCLVGIRRRLVGIGMQLVRLRIQLVTREAAIPCRWRLCGPRGICHPNLLCGTGSRPTIVGCRLDVMTSGHDILGAPPHHTFDFLRPKGGSGMEVGPTLVMRRKECSPDVLLPATHSRSRDGFRVAFRGGMTAIGRSVDPEPRPGRRPVERDAMGMLMMLVDAWHEASKASSTTAALAAIAGTAKRVLDASSAVIHVATASGPQVAPLPRAWCTLHIPVVGLRGDVIATLDIGRALSAGPFSTEDEAVGHAFGLMAANVIERGVSSRNLLAVLEHAPAAIFLKDQDLRYVAGNRRAAEMLGLESAAAMIGRHDSDFLPVSAALRIMASDRSILDGMGDVDTEEDAHWPLQGRRLLVHAFAVKSDDGEPIGVGGIVTDVTEHRLAGAAVIASERRYRLLLEHALDAIVVSDDEGQTIQVNPAVSTLLGWSRAELVGQRLADLVVDGDAEADAREHWQAFGSRGHQAPASRGYLRLRRRNGTICEAEYSVVANVEPGIHLGVFRDATERRQTRDDIYPPRGRL